MIYNIDFRIKIKEHIKNIMASNMGLKTKHYIQPTLGEWLSGFR